MSEYYKLIAFNVEKAKTPTNPDGLEVVTEDGASVTIALTNYDSGSGLKDDKGNVKYPIFVIAHVACFVLAILLVIIGAILGVILEEKNKKK